MAAFTSDQLQMPRRATTYQALLSAAVSVSPEFALADPRRRIQPILPDVVVALSRIAGLRRSNGRLCCERTATGDIMCTAGSRRRRAASGVQQGWPCRPQSHIGILTTLHSGVREWPPNHTGQPGRPALASVASDSVDLSRQSLDKDRVCTSRTGLPCCDMENNGLDKG